MEQNPASPGSYPLLRIALLYITGLFIAFLADLSFNSAYLFLLVIIVLVASVCFHRYRKKSMTYQYTGNSFYLVTILLFGVWQYHQTSTPTPADELLLQHFHDEGLVFHGIILSERSSRAGNTLLVIHIDSVVIDKLPVWNRPFRTEAFLRNNPDDSLDISSGSTISFHGDLRPPSQPANPNQFDYASFLSRRHIYSQIFITNLLMVDPVSSAGFWQHQQQRVTSSVNELFGPRNSALAKAIILGDRSELDPDLRTLFSRAGLAHLMAVSGMHVGFILLPVWIIMPWFRNSPALKATGLLVGSSVLLLYAGITGFSVSVSRASLMAFLMMIARLFHRPGTSLNILGAAAFLLLYADPLLLFDTGFQLSFTAVAVILTTLGPSRRLLPVKHRYGKRASLFQFISISVLVQGGLFPILVYYFHEFSLAGPISNSLAVPFVQFMFLWTFICLFVSSFSPALAAILNTPSDVILTFLTDYVFFAGSFSYAWISLTLPGPVFFLIWFFLIALFSSFSFPKIRWKMLCGLLLCLTLHSAIQAWQSYQKPVLTITVFDVGQGDAVLLQSPSGQHYLYDTGLWSPNYDSAERVILPELKAMGISRLNGVILSHPHSDHIGGMPTLLKQMPIDTIYQSPMSFDTRLFHRYMTKATTMNVPIRTVMSGDLIGNDPQLPILVLAPHHDITSQTPNNQSVVLMVVFGETRFLLTGDAEAAAESFLAETYGSFLKADLLKVAHHGSSTSSTEPFLSYVDAQKAVVSLAYEGRHRHPNEEAMIRLRDAGLQPRFTSLEGAILYQSCGKNMTHLSWRK